MIGMSVCGFARENLEMIVDMVENKQQRGRDFIPVFLTDSMEFDVFRARGFAFEYLPSSSSHRFAGTRPWPVYANRRLQLLVQKWNFARVITFGPEEFGCPNDLESDGNDLRRVEVATNRHQDSPEAPHEFVDGRDSSPIAH